MLRNSIADAGRGKTLPFYFVPKGGERMSENLETLKVSIEAKSSLKKGAQDAKKEARDIVSDINKEMEKVKSPFSYEADESDVAGFKNMLTYLKRMKDDVLSGALPKSIGAGAKNYVKEAQLDAGIRQPTEEYSELETDIENVTAALERLYEKEQKMTSLGTAQKASKQYDTLEKEIEDASMSLAGLIKSKERMQKSGNDQGKSFKTLQENIKNAESTLDALRQKQEEMDAAGLNGESQAWRSLQYDINNAEQSLQQYNARKSQMQASGTDTQFANQGLSSGSAIQAAGATVTSVKESVTRKLQEIQASVVQTIKRIPVIGRVATESAYVASKAFQGLKSAMQRVGPAIKKVGGFFGSLIQKFKSGIPLLNRTGKSMNGVRGSANGLGNGIFKLGNMFKTLTRMVMQNIINGAKEGFQNLVQYSSSTNASLSTLMSSMTQLKNSFAAAFVPILSVVTPILDALIQKVISAVNAIGQFFGALTGKTTYVQAKKVNQDYAASLGGASDSLNDNASSADNANKANEKLQRTLMGFDQINKLDDHSDSSSGSGGGSGGAASTGLSPGDMFETVGIDSKFGDLAQKIKDAWKNADFTEIGAMLGEKLNAALASIPWDKIKETARKIAKSIATFLNGFIETTDWGLVGKTLSECLNTVFEFVDEFAKQFHWDSFGKAAGDGINGALRNIDWSVINSAVRGVASGIAISLNRFISTTDWKLVGTSLGNGINVIINGAYDFVTKFNWKKFGVAIADFINSAIKKTNFSKAGKTLSELVKGLLDTLIQAIEKTNWKQVGEKIRDFLVAIDWKGIIRKVAEAFGAACGGLAALIGGLLGDAIQGAKEYFQDKIEECGGNVVLGILKGIGDAIVGIGKWLYDNVFLPIIDGFKKAFGINSPSTVMAEQGGYIISGLFGGIKDAIGAVIDWFKELPGKVKDALGNAKEWLVEKGKGAIEGIKNGYEAVKNSKFLSKVSKLKDEAFSAVGNIANKVKEKGKDIISGVKEGYENSKQNGLLSKVSTLKENVFTTIGNMASKVKEKGKDIISGVKEGYENSKQSGLLSKVATLRENVFSSIGNMASKVKEKGKDIVSGIKDGYTNNKDSLRSTVSGIPNLISNSIGSLWDIGKNAISSFISGFGSLRIPMPHISVGWNSHSVGGLKFSTPSFGVNWYAQGGFPGMGELFVANEAGPEMVGKMGNRNTVANSNQIVDGISAGVYPAVYDAVRDAMRSSGSSGSDGAMVLEFTLMCDSEILYQTTEKGKQKSNRRFNITQTV